IREPSDPHVRAADLERPRPLHVLALEPRRPGELGGERPARLERRAPDHPVQQEAGRLDVGERDEFSGNGHVPIVPPRAAAGSTVAPSPASRATSAARGTSTVQSAAVARSADFSGTAVAPRNLATFAYWAFVTLAIISSASTAAATNNAADGSRSTTWRPNRRSAKPRSTGY